MFSSVSPEAVRYERLRERGRCLESLRGFQVMEESWVSQAFEPETPSDRWTPEELVELFRGHGVAPIDWDR